MRQIVVLFLFLFIAGGSNFLQAQTLKGSSWKFFVQPLNDTFTMRLGVDTSFTTSGAGELVIRANYKLVNDTLKIKDIDGQYSCVDGEGVYRYTVDGDKLKLVMVSDPCNDRAGVLNGIVMVRKQEGDK
jgi:hypothetical protein